MDNLIKRLGGTKFLEKKAKTSFDWIVKSFEVNDNKGSSAFLSQLKGWSFPYPETTGYLLATLLEYGDHFGDHKAHKLIKEQVNFFLEIQNEDGSFPRFVHEESTALVFDTGQILLGLNSISKLKEYRSTELDRVRKKAFEWLVSTIDTFGRFSSHNFVEDYVPSYYTRTLWAMYQYKQEGINEAANTKLERALDYYISLQNENLSFKDWSFEPNNSALTHTIAYTLRGLYEIALLENNEHLVEIVKSTLKKLAAEVKDNTWQIAGTYDQDWSGNYSFICACGNAQLFILFVTALGPEYFDIRVYESLMGPLIKSQRKVKTNKSFGAVPSSIPFWGKYQRFRYTNWTQKFYLDALLVLLSKKE